MSARADFTKKYVAPRGSSLREIVTPGVSTAYARPCIKKRDSLPHFFCARKEFFVSLNSEGFVMIATRFPAII